LDATSLQRSKIRINAMKHQAIKQILPDEGALLRWVHYNNDFC
jgi:hypothetical protein